MAASLFLVVLGLFLLVGVAAFVWWLVALIEVVRVPSTQWEAAGQSQLVHIVLMALLGVLGTLVYWFTARPALKRTGAL